MKCVTNVFCFQAEDGIRDLVRSRGLGDVYKRQLLIRVGSFNNRYNHSKFNFRNIFGARFNLPQYTSCLLYTSDAADERSSVDLGGRRIIKKQKLLNTYQ